MDINSSINMNKQTSINMDRLCKIETKMTHYKIKTQLLTVIAFSLNELFQICYDFIFCFSVICVCDTCAY